ncbi:FMN-binding protein [Sediminispirochaeta bajacaliforniensis]|uniref:FMN-binding protein n=1 Tax=Sediminispirochaeta bajacaliforniensis TaxID=148 RepID=UPI000364AC9C|nr:FMN-binding protein [Sediminispirochaeta bajacaliforniensis]
MNNPIVKIGGRLALICAVAALVLGAVNALTEPQIARIKAEKLKAALETVSGGRKTGEAVAVDNDSVVDRYYPVYGDDDQIAGYVCRLLGNGYGGTIVILGGYDLKGTVLAAKMMDNEETPGLGKEAEKASYMEKYVGTGGDKPVPVRKSMLTTEQSDSVTGASITFMGVGKALQEGSRFVVSLEGK